jgi:hypothetical protein
MIETMTTTGYGDAYPKTETGRCVAFVGCIIGNVLLSLMVIALSTSANLN